MTDIDYIISLIETGKAYTVPTEMGEFVCAERSKFPNLKVSPVQYALLDGKKYKDDDFPIWAPYKEGRLSPYGKGQPTVNLHLIQSTTN